MPRPYPLPPPQPSRPPSRGAALLLLALLALLATSACARRRASPPPLPAEPAPQSRESPEAGSLATPEVVAEATPPPDDPALPTDDDAIAASRGRATSALALGLHHSCALKDDGRVFCWGDDSVGQLGNGRAAAKGTSPVPVPVPGLPPIVELAAHRHLTCGRSRKGGVYCWGGSFDPLFQDEPATCAGRAASASGDGPVVFTPHCAPEPVRIPVAPATSLGVTDAAGCVTGEDGAVWCWGSPAFVELVRQPEGKGKSVLRRVEIGGPAEAVLVASDFACARRKDAEVLCWGYGAVEATCSDRPLSGPTVIPAFRGAVELSFGGMMCGRLASGEARCCGGKRRVHAGPEPSFVRLYKTPAHVRALDGASRLAAVSGGVCGIFEHGKAVCASSEGAAVSRGIPPKKPGASTKDRPSAVLAAAAAPEHECVVTGEGSVLCRGDNELGELGDGSTTTSEAFVLVKW